jgi:hypothetical protein
LRVGRALGLVTAFVLLPHRALCQTIAAGQDPTRTRDAIIASLQSKDWRKSRSSPKCIG